MAHDIDHHAAKASPVTIMKHIAGVGFPASKGDLLATAKEKGAPDDVIQALEYLPGDTFGGPNEVMNAFERE